ncbi:MAG: restriction endonuclease subunit S [Candidatus Omnitrophica bacterium]|nr:restriction endonuclease subunit S [Candidatus Omnitrophota bacterium]
MFDKPARIKCIYLPAGVFNPYSGVKTSILMLDKNLAKKTNKILFAKINNDGFGLGAQRREVKGSDLPLALEVIKRYKQSIIENKDFEFNADEAKLASLIEKKIIAESGDYNLGGDRYKEALVYSGKWNFVELGNVCEILNGYAFKSENYVKDGIRVLRITNVQKGVIVDENPKFYSLDTKESIEQYKLVKDDLLMSLTGNVGRVGLLPNYLLPAALNQRVACLRNNGEKVDKRFLFHLLNQDIFEQSCIASSKGIAQKNLSTVWLSNYKIPLPPLEVQEQIVVELDNYQKIIDGARQVVENYKPHIDIDPDWEMVELGKVCKPEYGFTERAKEKGDVRFVRITDIGQDGKLINDEKKYIDLTATAKKYLLKKGDVLVARTGATFGKTMMFNEDYEAVFASFLIRLVFLSKKITPDYYWVFAQSQSYWDQANSLMTGGGQPQFNGNAIKKIKLPMPSIDSQREIVAQVEQEQKIIDANKKLIEMYEQKVKDRIAKVWGEKVV